MTSPERHRRLTGEGQLVEVSIAGKCLRPDLTDVDLVAQTIWSIVHGAASFELTIDKQEAWIDFKPRRERFAAALRTLVRAMFRDAAAGEKQLELVLADTPAFGEPKKAKKARAKPAPKKG